MGDPPREEERERASDWVGRAEVVNVEVEEVPNVIENHDDHNRTLKDVKGTDSPFWGLLTVSHGLRLCGTQGKP